VPYPHKSKQVTAEGFIRDIPTLPEKVLKRIDNWHKERGVKQSNKETNNAEGGS
jgi:hypothetical protein